MDKEKETRLRNFYKEIPEQQLLDMLSEDEKDFEDGVYALLVEEAKRRGLEDKLNEIKINKEQQIADDKQPTYKFQKIFTTPKIEEISIIKSILDSEKIPYYIRGENFGTLYGPADGLSSVDIMIREDYADDAKDLLKDFISPTPSKEKDEQLYNVEPIVSTTRPFIKITIISVLIVLFIIIGFITIRNYSARTVFNKGYWYAKEGKYDEAIAEFSKAIKIKPDLAAAYMNRGAAYQQKGNFYQAVLDFSDAIKIVPRYAKAYSWRGYVYSRKENYDLAITDYNKAIELNPNDANAYVNRGRAYYKKGNYDQAISDCIRAIELKPNYASAYNDRGYFYLLKGNFAQAISDCTKAIEFNPKLDLAFYNRGLAYYYTEQYEKSLADYAEAIKLKPDKESYKEFIEHVPEKRSSDIKNIREKILNLFKEKIDLSIDRGA